jgi:N-acetyl-gamma-glutamyl-phosphate reductase
MTIRVGIIGATGYTGLEVLKLLLRHPEAQVVALASRQEGCPSIAEIHPQLTGRLSLPLENLTPQQLAGQCDCVMSCLPHGASAASVRELLQCDVRVIDFSADYRLNNAATYQRWYDVTHPDPDRIGSTPYGLPEFFADRIRSAPLVANPGCYPTSAILALAPLLRAGAVSPDDLIVDSKSGVSGAGRTPKLTTHFPECNENFSAYNVGKHRHGPEIQQMLSEVAGKEIGLIFTPHLVPMDRGILTTAYARRSDERGERELMEILREAYASCPFVRVSDELPATKNTAHTNFCDISLRVVADRVIVISCLDNLIKGASGAAVQNMNVMFDLPETMGLL